MERMHAVQSTMVPGHPHAPATPLHVAWCASLAAGASRPGVRAFSAAGEAAVAPPAGGLVARLKEDMKAAMKAKDSARLDAIRMIQASIKTVGPPLSGLGGGRAAGGGKQGAAAEAAGCMISEHAAAAAAAVQCHMPAGLSRMPPWSQREIELREKGTEVDEAGGAGGMAGGREARQRAISTRPTCGAFAMCMHHTFRPGGH